MSNITAINHNAHKYEIEMEVDLSAAGAVLATRGDGVSCVKSSTATYTFTISGNSLNARKLYKVLKRHTDINGTPATITRAIITSVSQANDTDTLTVVVKTTNATFVETATTGACTLTVELAFQTQRMDNPFA